MQTLCACTFDWYSVVAHKIAHAVGSVRQIYWSWTIDWRTTLFGFIVTLAAGALCEIASAICRIEDQFTGTWVNGGTPHPALVELIACIRHRQQRIHFVAWTLETGDIFAPPAHFIFGIEEIVVRAACTDCLTVLANEIICTILYVSSKSIWTTMAWSNHGCWDVTLSVYLTQRVNRQQE